MLEFDAGVCGCKVPVGPGMLGVAVRFPGGDFVNQRRFVGNAAVEALRAQNAEFGFGEVEPTAVLGSVVPFEALRQAAGFGGRKGLVKRSRAVDIEIVLDENDLRGAGKVMIGQFFQHLSIVDGSMAIGDLDMAPAFEGRTP